MIVEWLIAASMSVGAWLVGLFPPLELPTELEHLDDTLSGLISDNAAGLAAFIDFGYISVIVGVPLVVWAAALLIRAIRAGVAHVPFFGGRG